ncbi:MAG: NAD-dependent epimerase/dehydratase family protein [Actinomycetota bacterium]
MIVLVTGGAGFIGSHVAEALLADGHEVRILDSLHPDAHGSGPPHVPAGAEFVRGDVADPADAAEAVRGVEAISHQAARVGLGVDLRDAPGYVRDNDLGTAVLLAALTDAGFAGRLVLASSMVVYGEGGYRCEVHGPVRPAPREAGRLRRREFEPVCPDCGRDLEAVAIDETVPPDPRNVYAATKLHQEHLCAVFGRERGVPVTALRYHNVYGPRMPRDTPYAGVASLFRSALERGESPRVFEDGAQRRDFIHVDDVARANVLALTAEPPVGGAVNVATGSPHTVLEMAEALAAGRGGPGGPAPVVTGEFRLGDVRHVFASPARAEQVLGFRARVGFAEGMEAFATAALREPAQPGQT